MGVAEAGADHVKIEKWQKDRRSTRPVEPKGFRRSGKPDLFCRGFPDIGAAVRAQLKSHLRKKARTPGVKVFITDANPEWLAIGVVTSETLMHAAGQKFRNVLIPVHRWRSRLRQLAEQADVSADF